MNDEYFDEVDDNDSQEMSEETITEYDIVSNPNDYNIESLYNLMKNGVIVIPRFQRNYVWDRKKLHALLNLYYWGYRSPLFFYMRKRRINGWLLMGNKGCFPSYFLRKINFQNQKIPSVEI